MPFRLIGLLSILFLVVPAPAQAVEVWTMMESRVALSENHRVLPEQLRIFSQYRYGTSYGYFGQALLRVGPIWNPAPWLTVATHLTTALAHDGPGIYEQELRAELEPTLRHEWGDLELSDRSRLEHSWFPDGQRWRYRNQVRVAFTPDTWPWRPYVSEEAFWVIGRGWSENRVQLGVSHYYFPQGRTDVGYLFRGENEATGWQFTHLATLTLFFGARNQPFVRGPAAD
jgi:Protein of unknown function (DUF2490)